MPGVGGAEVTRKLLATGTEARVVVLPSLSARERILDALDAGAIGYMLKDAEPDELIRGIRAAARGESPLAPKAAQVVIHARQREGYHAGQLTDREREVLSLIAQGHANKRIALELGIAEKTVKAHASSIFER